jgi:hypothetical protein
MKTKADKPGTIIIACAFTHNIGKIVEGMASLAFRVSWIASVVVTVAFSPFEMILFRADVHLALPMESASK